MFYYILKEGVEPFLNVRYLHPLKQQQVSELIKKIKTEYPQIEYVAVFGSTVDGRCTDLSDIDICVWNAKGIHFSPPNNDVYDVIYAEDVSYDSQLRKEIEEGVLVYIRDDLYPSDIDKV